MQNHTVVPGNSLLTRGKFTFREIVDAFMVQYAGRDGNMASRIKPFFEQLGSKLAHEIDSDDIQDVLDAIAARGAIRNCGGREKGGNAVLTGRPLSPSTMNRYRAAASAVLTWARKKRLMPKGWSNPTAEVEQLSEGAGRVRYLTAKEYEDLLKAARISAWPRLKALIVLAVTTGVRRGSLLSLTWADVDLEAQRAYVDRTKNGSEFVIVLTPDAVAELEKIRGNAADDHFVFCGKNPHKKAAFEASWKAALAASRIEGACFHTLRHTHASWLAQNGAQLLEIAESMNHKSLAMTRRYAHLCVDNRAKLLNRVFAAAA